MLTGMPGKTPTRGGWTTKNYIFAEEGLERDSCYVTDVGHNLSNLVKRLKPTGSFRETPQKKIQYHIILIVRVYSSFKKSQHNPPAAARLNFLGY